MHRPQSLRDALSLSRARVLKQTHMKRMQLSSNGKIWPELSLSAWLNLSWKCAAVRGSSYSVILFALLPFKLHLGLKTPLAPSAPPLNQFLVYLVTFWHLLLGRQNIQTSSLPVSYCCFLFGFSNVFSSKSYHYTTIMSTSYLKIIEKAPIFEKFIQEENLSPSPCMSLNSLLVYASLYLNCPNSICPPIDSYSSFST